MTYRHSRTRLPGSARLLLLAPVIGILSTLHCLQTVPSETGVLQLSLAWDQPPEQGTAEKTGAVDIQSIAVTADPGAVTQTFFSWDSALSMDLALGIYTISVRALDSGERTLYEGEAEKILVQPLETTALTVAMSSRFPAEAPAFIEPADTAYSSDGNYQLLWSSCARADTYVLEESADNSFTSPTQIYSGADTSFNVTGRDEGVWHYRVRGENELAASAWSSSAVVVVSYVPPLRITTESPLPDGLLNVAYSQNITAEGGSTDWSWELTEGNLPAGMDFLDFGETGRIQGAPSETGTFTFTVSVSDVIYPGLSDTKEFSLTVSGPPALFISTGSLPDGRADQSYSITLQAAGGTPPYTWSEDTRTLGFAESIILGSTGVLSGMPNPQPESGSITFRVTDSGSPAQTATRTLGLTIDPGTLALQQAYLPEGTAGNYYSAYILYKYGTGPLEAPWTISGDWPEDVVISYDMSNYQMNISGTPTASGTHNFSITVRDSGSPQQTRTDSFTITIN